MKERLLYVDGEHCETVIALSEALDARDEYTAGHSHRVMKYSVTIARQINLSDKEIDHLKKSALLHDLGKIGIPDVILHKKSGLSDEEYAVVKKHPQIAATILKAIGYFKDLIPAIYYHHERFDGRGYPAGIRGEEIPLHARIIAVADSFDAMTSCRPYRESFPLQKALAELENNRGTQFDPNIADVFIGVINDNPDFFNLIREPEYYL